MSKESGIVLTVQEVICEKFTSNSPKKQNWRDPFTVDKLVARYKKRRNCRLKTRQTFHTSVLEQQINSRTTLVSPRHTACQTKPHHDTLGSTLEEYVM